MTVTSSHPCTFWLHLGLLLYPPGLSGLSGLSGSSHSCRDPGEGGYSPDPVLQYGAENVGSGICLLKFESWCCVTLSQLMDLPELSSSKRVVGRVKRGNTDSLAQHLAHSECSTSVCCCCPHQKDPPMADSPCLVT